MAGEPNSGTMGVLSSRMANSGMGFGSTFVTERIYDETTIGVIHGTRLFRVLKLSFERTDRSHSFMLTE
jgi:hypothetical protein